MDLRDSSELLSGTRTLLVILPERERQKEREGKGKIGRQMERESEKEKKREKRKSKHHQMPPYHLHFIEIPIKYKGLETREGVSLNPYMELRAVQSGHVLSEVICIDILLYTFKRLY